MVLGESNLYERDDTVIEIKKEDINSENARILLGDLNKALSKITGCSGAGSFDISDMENSRCAFVIAYVDGKPMGCGAIRELNQDTAEIKRVFAYPNTYGVGSRIIDYLEEQAWSMRYTSLKLETRKVNVKAVNFYKKNGYQICSNYGRYIGHDEAICFIKRS